MKILRFVNEVFSIGLTILSNFKNANSLNAIPLSGISMKNQECKTRPQVVNVNGDEPVFFPFSIETSKCSGSCNNANYPYAKSSVPDVIKNLNIKVFNLMSRTNETRFIEWRETKQRWNKNKCRRECQELIDKGVCDKGLIWNP